MAVLMFLFDWRMGLLCLGTVLLAIPIAILAMRLAEKVLAKPAATLE